MAVIRTGITAPCIITQFICSLSLCFPALSSRRRSLFPLLSPSLLAVSAFFVRLCRSISDSPPLPVSLARVTDHLHGSIYFSIPLSIVLSIDPSILLSIYIYIYIYQSLYLFMDPNINNVIYTMYFPPIPPTHHTQQVVHKPSVKVIGSR